MKRRTRGEEVVWVVGNAGEFWNVQGGCGWGVSRCQDWGCPGVKIGGVEYDDDRVTPVTDHDVFEDNYGGEAPNANQLMALRPQTEASKKVTSAYILVYIRESNVDEVLAPMAP
ncbi:hypothetical protein BC938DRAFT_475341, partial [Jimgerdemannia flammicorona]